MYFLLSIYITYSSTVSLAENKISTPKKCIPFTAMGVNFFRKNIFKYKRPNNKSFQLGRVGGLTYIQMQVLKIVQHVTSLFSYIKSLTNIWTVTLFFLPVEELLENLENNCLYIIK